MSFKEAIFGSLSVPQNGDFSRRDIDNGAELLGLFQEYKEGKTPEAQFIKRVDRLEMMFQAREYGIDQPGVDLKSFWNYIQDFDFGNLKEMYDSLEIMHKGK